MFGTQSPTEGAMSRLHYSRANFRRNAQLKAIRALVILVVVVVFVHLLVSTLPFPLDLPAPVSRCFIDSTCAGNIRSCGSTTTLFALEALLSLCSNPLSWVVTPLLPLPGPGLPAPRSASCFRSDACS